MRQIFISYAREDRETAERIYGDLQREGLDPWIDSKNLLPGSQWKMEITKAIHESRYVILILSSNSVNKRGYVQKEVRESLAVLDEFPDTESFIIPVRLEECEPSHLRLKDLQWTDLFPSYEDGIESVLRAVCAPSYTSTSRDLRLQWIKQDSKSIDVLSEKWSAIERVETSGDPVEVYEIHFDLKGITRISSNNEPVFSRQHILRLELHRDYPMSLPFSKFLTPIFHPNVYSTGTVCSGWHEIPYSLDQIIVHIARMVDYQILNPDSAADSRAADWARGNSHLFPLSGWEPPKIRDEKLRLGKLRMGSLR